MSQKFTTVERCVKCDVIIERFLVSCCPECGHFCWLGRAETYTQAGHWSEAHTWVPKPTRAAALLHGGGCLGFVLAAVLGLGLMLSTGCATSPRERAEEAPIMERPEWLKAPDGFLLAMWGTIWVPRGQLEMWEHPTTAAQKALLEHERQHVQRQYEVGLFEYHMRYSNDRKFRWQEEKAAYEKHAALLWHTSPESRTTMYTWLSTIVVHDFYNGMVSREEARRWAEATVIRIAEEQS